MIAGIIKQTLPLLCVTLSAIMMVAAASDERSESPLIFSHSLHVDENEIECEACHSEVLSSTTDTDLRTPSMETCADCHDVEDDELCGQCHRDPEDPLPALPTGLSTMFNHERHLALGAACETCHDLSLAETTGKPGYSMPGKPLCMSCHDGLRASRDCQLCHNDGTDLQTIHPPNWRHQHAEQAVAKEPWCRTCHNQQDYCVNCHFGDNLTGNIHDLNYVFTHGLDAEIKEKDCSRCHERESFCVDCHNREGRMPRNHSTVVWIAEHGSAARADVENCASCHETDDLTCARPGCHLDTDGIRGTDPRIHSSASGRFDGHGPWHNDAGYFCYTCHISSRQAGEAFCGYCHGGAD